MGVNEHFLETLKRIAKESDKASGDAYWLRRWAGEAMKAIIVGEEVPPVDTTISTALRYAHAMLKAFKEKEKEDHSEPKWPEGSLQ